MQFKFTHFSQAFHWVALVNEALQKIYNRGRNSTSLNLQSTPQGNFFSGSQLQKAWHWIKALLRVPLSHAELESTHYNTTETSGTHWWLSACGGWWWGRRRHWRRRRHGTGRSSCSPLTHLGHLASAAPPLRNLSQWGRGINIWLTVFLSPVQKKTDENDTKKKLWAWSLSHHARSVETFTIESRDGAGVVRGRGVDFRGGREGAEGGVGGGGSGGSGGGSGGCGAFPQQQL